MIGSAPALVSDSLLADTMIGKAVEHMFETEDGPKEEWRGMVLARAPIITSWFYITYEKDPVLYMYQLLDDYKEGDLRIMPDSSECSVHFFRSLASLRPEPLRRHVSPPGPPSSCLLLSGKTVGPEMNSGLSTSL